MAVKTSWARRARVVALCSLLSAFCPWRSALSPPLHAEIIDRVLAILPGQIVTQSDVEAALNLGLVEPSGGGNRLAEGLTALIDRMLMLNEVRRVQPPEPSAAAIEARLARIRERFRSGAEMSQVLAAGGIDESVLRAFAADDLRLGTYLDERFSAASQPTEQEVREASGSSREKLAAERRQTLVGAWIAELRRRTEITVLLKGESEK